MSRLRTLLKQADMELKGKCKEDFEKWLLIWLKKNVAWEMEVPNQEDIDHFYKFPDSMQYGVLVDFFDENNISVETNTYLFLEPTLYQGFVNNEIASDEVKSLPEARKAAILKALEIYNNI